MPNFKINAIDTQGKFISRRITARDTADALKKVKGWGFFPVNVSGEDYSSGEESDKQQFKKQRKKIDIFAIFTIFSTIKKRDIVDFTRKLRTFMQAGIPIYQSLFILQKQTRKKSFVRIIKKVTKDVESGKSFAEALGIYKKYFNHLYISLANAGERSGNLVEVLVRLESYIDNTIKRRSKLISAAIYPSIVVIMTFGIIALLNIVVIPKFKKSYDALSIELPKLTTGVLETSSWISSHWYVLIFVPAFMIIALKISRGYKAVRYATDYLLLRIPLIGKILLKVNLSLFYRTLSTLLRSGTTILDSFKISGPIIKNRVINSEINLISAGVYEGKTMENMMKRSWLFDSFAIYMVEVGEEAGILDEMLEKISDAYDEELDILFKRLEAAIEPIIIITLAGIVGTVVVALYLPMVKLTETLGNLK